MIMVPRFDEADVDAACLVWGANCGPGALAAICGLTLDEVRAHMGDFEQKHYTNPMLMFDSLRRLESHGITWRRIANGWPRYGLVRVQWEGPWTEPGVPRRARYRYTHWIGAATRGDDRGVWDINCMNNGTGWASLDDWSRVIVPHLTARYKGASGKWHITHGVEVVRDAL
jgi:hypothetical protein